MLRNRRSILKSLLLGLFFAALVTLAAMLLIAAALIYLRFSEALLTVLNQIVKLSAVALGCTVAVPRGGERGLITGVVIALGYSAMGYALYVLLGGGSFTTGGMLGEMLLCAAVGAVTGAIRANLQPISQRSRA